MNILRFSFFSFLSFLLTFSCLSSPVSAKNAPVESPSVGAKHAVLYEPQTQTFLYEKAADTRAPMASTTKIMTALVTLEHAPLDRRVKIGRESCGIEGSSLYMKEGDIYTIEQLLYALLLQSANDAAVALAYDIGGSVEGFCALMNARAESLGLTDTHFENPHGLPAENHYTTAKELCLIAAAAMENPVFAQMVATQRYTLPVHNGEATRVLVNHNKLLRLYDDAVGVKTGFTRESGRCLVGAARHDGLTLLAVTLNAGDDWNDHMSLFEYGFGKMENRLLCSAGDFLFGIPLIGGGTVYCQNAQDVYAVVSRSAPTPVLSVDLPHMLSDAHHTGDAVGHLLFSLDGEEIASVPLVIASFSPNELPLERHIPTPLPFHQKTACPPHF